jgi:hypothetical protein
MANIRLGGRFHDPALAVSRAHHLRAPEEARLAPLRHRLKTFLSLPCGDASALGYTCS